MFRAVPGQGAGQAKCHADTGGGVAIREGGVWHTTRPFFAVPVLVFRPRPDDTRRASGEGLDGSDPPFLTAGAVSRWGWCGTRCGTWCGTPTPPPGGALPSVCIPAGRLPGPHAGRTISHTDRPDA